MRASKCYRCGSRIRFVLLPSHRWIAINPRPHPEGNVVVVRRGGTLHGTLANAHWYKENVPGLARFMCHYLTCKPSGPDRQQKASGESQEG